MGKKTKNEVMKRPTGAVKKEDVKRTGAAKKEVVKKTVKYQRWWSIYRSTPKATAARKDYQKRRIRKHVAGRNEISTH